MWLRVIALFALASVASAPAAAALGAGGSVMEPPGGHAARAQPVLSTAAEQVAAEIVESASGTDAQPNSADRQHGPASPAPSAAADRAPLAIFLITLDSPRGGPTGTGPQQGLPATAAFVLDGSGAADAARRVVSSIAPGEDVFPPTRGWWGG